MEPHRTTLSDPPTPQRVSFVPNRYESPEAASDEVQYATYPEDHEKERPSGHPSGFWNGLGKRSKQNKTEEEPPWVPMPLQRWFWITFVAVLVGLAIALEVAYHFSKKNLGWRVQSGLSKVDDYLHYAISLPPVIVAMGIVAAWANTDLEIKKLQPYVDLIRGDSPAHRSLLLDYTRTTNFLVWFNAAANRHLLVFLATLMALLSLTFQPLASALFEVRDTFIPQGDRVVSNLASFGLHQDLQFDDLTYFLAATNFAAASVLYKLPDPPFIFKDYAVAPFGSPYSTVANGTVVANTTAIRSQTNCVAVEPVKIKRDDNTGWDVTGTREGCSMNWSVDKNTTTLFGAGVPTCTAGKYASRTPAFLPVVFWFFTYKPTALASATFCYPTVTPHLVEVSLDLTSSNITSLREVGVPNDLPDGLSFLPAAYNGIAFDHLPTPLDRFTAGRRDAIQLQMPSAMLQAAAQSEQGVVSFFESGNFVSMTEAVYTTYLNLVAKSVYFEPTDQAMMARVTVWEKRVWLTNISTHLLTAGLLLLAIIAVIIQREHKKARQNLRLYHEPGTIASAVSFGARTGMGDLLAREAPQSEKQFMEVLGDKKFRIDPVSRRILMEGEEGYEDARTPAANELHQRRKSVFAAFQRERLRQRESGEIPSTPRTPV